MRSAVTAPKVAEITIQSFQAARDLRVEAEAIEAWYGPNAYSRYLRQHGQRPDAEEAATIGRLLGGRVKAADGSMQPSLTAADRKVLKGIKSRRAAFARRYEQIARLKTAIAALAENEDDPAEVIGDGSLFLDNPEIVAQLENAVLWLNRFAEYWYGRTQTVGTAGQELSCSDQERGRT